VRDIDERPRQHLPGLVRRGGQVLVQHAFPAPVHARGDQRIALVFGARHVAGQHAAVRLQRRPCKAFGHAQLLVGIDEQQVVAVRPRQLQRLVAVVGEVHPGPLVQAAGYALHATAHQILRAIAGARVHDHPMVHPRLDRGQATRDHRGLVLDDHVQADAGAETLVL